MITCSNCNKELPDYSRFCDSCGMQQLVSSAREEETPATYIPETVSIDEHEPLAEKDSDLSYEPENQPRYTEPAFAPQAVATPRAAPQFSPQYNPHSAAPQYPAENPFYNPRVPVMSLGQAVAFVIITLIPVLNFIMMCAWAFGGHRNPSRRNMARATLIVWLVLTAMSIAAVIAAVVVSSSMGYGFYPSY